MERGKNVRFVTFTGQPSNRRLLVSGFIENV